MPDNLKQNPTANQRHKYLCPGCTNEAFFSNGVVKSAPIPLCPKCGKALDPLDPERFVEVS